MDPASLRLFDYRSSHQGQAPGESSPYPVGGAHAFGKVLKSSSHRRCRKEESLPGSQESLEVVQGAVQGSQHGSEQQLVVLCNKALMALRYRDCQATDCVPAVATGKWDRTCYGWGVCTEQMQSPSQTLCYSSHSVGEGRTACLM